ncbi:MAG: hypothetical protein F6K17_24490 [Okeania sp. SIO3C4]|nr:hypothetical protein [Okeania sp. SIO3B3]NER05520.1 hypothetical protein [Okeania sp. SIO3C4]
MKSDDYQFNTQIEEYYLEEEYDKFDPPSSGTWWGPYFWPVRGHLSASTERSRSIKDLYSTFLTTNIVPQDKKGNGSVWSSFETHLQTNFKELQHKIYVVSGVYGTGGGQSNPNIFQEFQAQTNPEEKIAVPDKLWKVVMGFYKGSTSEYPDYAYGVLVPNNALDVLEIEYNNKGKPRKVTSKKWSDFRYTIKELETILNRDLEDSGESFEYDFLSNITDPQIKKNLKEKGQSFV